MPTIRHKNYALSQDTTNSQQCVPRIHSTDLFRGNRRLIIEHANEEYCLRLTRNKRLILTKD